MAIPVWRPLETPKISLPDAIKNLQLKGRNLNLERDVKNGPCELRSTFGKLVPANGSYTTTPVQSIPGRDFHIAANAFEYKRDLFKSLCKHDSNFGQQGQRINKIVENVAGANALANMAIRPTNFLVACNNFVDQMNRSSPPEISNFKNLLKNEAETFIAETTLALSQMDDAIQALSEISEKQGDAADSQRQALLAMRKDCLNSALYQDVIAFAGQVQDSPDAAVAYFNSRPTVRA